MVFVNSSKGNKLLKNIKDKIHLETRTLEDVLIGNPYLFGQAVQKGDRERFFKLLDTKPFSEAVKATYTENVTQKMKRYIKLFLKRVLKRKMVSAYEMNGIFDYTIKWRDKRNE